MPKYTILCVDDERNVLFTLRTQLIRNFPDYKIEIAESGAEALEVLQKCLADGKEIPLVIVDQIMPMMKGDELLIEIHAQYPDIIKVMLTGQAHADEVGNVVNRAKLYRFISKPWNEIDLQLTVSEAIHRYQQDQLIAQQRRALEENLQQSQYFIKRITESVPNLLYIFDIAQQSNIYANYATKNLFDYSDDEIRQLGARLISDNCHLADRHKFYESLERCSNLKDGEFVETEYRVKDAQGQWRWLLCHNSVFIRADDGTVKQILSSCQDISDRRQAEELLELQNRWLSCVALDEPLSGTLELLIELIEFQLVGSICSILMLDEKNRLNKIAAPNLPPAYAKMLNGIPIGEGVGSCGTATFRGQLVITSDIATDPLWKDFKHLVLPHGLKSCWSMPIFARDQGKVLGTLGIYYREVRQPSAREIDIIKMAATSAGIAIERHLNEATIQRQLQQEQFLYRHLQQELNDRQEAEAMLSESEELFRRAFDDSAAGMALISIEGQLLQVNQSLCELIGYSESELLEHTWQELTLAEDIAPQLKLVEELIVGNRKTFQIEKRIIHRQGNILWVFLNMSIVRDENGNPLYFVAHLQDITDRRQLEIIKDEFISVVSHELRTPLTAIRGALGILHSGVYEQRPEKAKHMLKIALNNSDRLSRLVDDILDLESLESEQAQLIMEICQINDLMQESIDAVQEIALQSSVTLNYTPLSGEVWAAEDAIMQTLINLLGNAIKFSPEGSMVLLSAEVQDENIRFAIKDQGRGIPPDHLEKIFGRFQQVDVSDSRQKVGTGLGLAICKSIVQQHGGQIWVESILGEGSTFYFTLPVDRTDR